MREDRSIPVPEHLEEIDTLLGPEDYAEPRCTLCGDPYGVTPETRPVPQQRIIAKMDDYMRRRDYDGAERHLLYWLEEAVLGHDHRGELMLRGELVGHYRKTGNKDRALPQIQETLRLVLVLGYSKSISGGTAFVNCATALQAFGEPERALKLFEKARAAYEASEFTRPDLLGGLYNNMALTCSSLGRYDEALALYEKALDVMKESPNGEPEQAITCLNMANTAEAQLGLESEEAQRKIEGLLDRAEALLAAPSVPRDGYYAFVCEKCAPTFSYYGRFLTAKELRETSERIYRENQEK